MKRLWNELDAGRITAINHVQLTIGGCAEKLCTWTACDAVGDSNQNIHSWRFLKRLSAGGDNVGYDVYHGAYIYSLLLCFSYRSNAPFTYNTFIEPSLPHKIS